MRADKEEGCWLRSLSIDEDHQLNVMAETMADYNLNGLNVRDFQHLVQALARKRIAAGVTSFGDGPDGARDLTYRGKMDYPSVVGGWDGDLVLGCKFNQRPSGDSKRDGEWVITQLSADLDKFLDPRRNLPKPEYYILATNIALSGVAGSGGRDRATRLLDEYTPRLGLKGSAIWDYNDLRGLLDGDRDVCTTYGSFITAGDVLAEMMKFLKLQRPDFAHVAHAFLQKELLADMSAKLQSAGEDPELQIPLANVFVDLPVTDSPEAAALSRERPDPNRTNVVELLLRAGERVLRRRSAEQESSMTTDPSLRDAPKSRFVLVGGPGQGKSTLAQYICQLHRAALLRDRPIELLEDRVPGIIRQLAEQRESAGGLPIARRFPIRVELKAFSQALANDSDLTLLEYLRREMARLGSAAVTLDDLMNWLASYPWLLLLDGLDEVPPSSNRTDVMQQIEHLRVDAATRNADILIVATTRPQSYSKEFPIELFQHLYLTPLSPEQALEYGKRLAHARCVGDERRRDELVRSLEKACENEATARLMQSPLQVTIMAALLEETGEPPQQRYRLFAEYYRTIYKRETRRKLLLGILSERQTDIDNIHAQTGLLLHAMGEQTRKRGQLAADELESALSDDQFRELVRRRLARIGVTEPKASDLLYRITDGSLQRLVFLVRPTEGWIRFDIPSFKEFMAAEALMNGPDESIRDRIELVAPAAYWRNVLLFAIGKCFVEKEHLLDSVVSICTGLSDDKTAGRILGEEIAGATAKATLWGSRLALDILSDGTARQNPEYEFRLAKTALELTRVSDPEVAARLAAVWHPDLSGIFRDAIEDRLGQAQFRRQRGSWLLLMNLADRDIDWARDMVERHWPVEPARQANLLLAGSRDRWLPWAASKLVAIFPHCDPTELARAMHRHGVFRKKSDRWLDGAGHLPDWWSAAIAVVGFRTQAQQIRIQIASSRFGARNRLSLSLAPFSTEGDHPWSGLRSLPPHHTGWAPYVAAARFASNPTASTLAEELRWLAEKWTPGRLTWVVDFPWPIAACLSAATTKKAMQLLAERAECGRLGSADIWAAAEARWSQNGVTDDDFHWMVDDRWPFDEGIADRGFPFAACNGSAAPDDSPEKATMPLLWYFRRIDQSRMKSWLASNLLYAMMYGRPFSDRRGLSVALSDLRAILSAAKTDLPWVDLDDLIPRPLEVDQELIDFLDWLGRELTPFVRFDRPWPQTERLVHSFAADPQGRRGLLRVLAALATSGAECVVPREVLEVCRRWEHAEEDYLLLRLARGDWNPAEGRELARAFVKLRPDAGSVWRALRVLQFSTERMAAFVLALLSELSASDTDETQALEIATSSLIEYLTKRPSSLSDPAVWQRLKLPDLV